ncbi:MAG: hypothetical protein D6744_01050 [Planctomycetota bacterium]|nr:MAG: hypothetical protein D6744_01050 [Planctomycetota bacterium]
MKRQKKKPNIVSVQLSPEAKADLDAVCEARGMTIKTLLGRLIEWFVAMDKTEQSIVLRQVEDADIVGLAELIKKRRNGASKSSRRPRGLAAQG